MAVFLVDNKLDISYVLLTHWHGVHTGYISDPVAYKLELASRICKNAPNPSQLPIEEGQIFQVEGDNVLSHGYTVEEDLGSARIHAVCAAWLTSTVPSDIPPTARRLQIFRRKWCYWRHRELWEKQVLELLIDNRNCNGGALAILTVKELVEALHGNSLIRGLFDFALKLFATQLLWNDLAAVQQAGSALWADQADTSLAGGLSVITNPDNYAMLCKGFFLSRKRSLEDAEADNDNILAVIAAGATNHSAGAISNAHSHAGAQAYNYRQVMHSAGVDPLDVSYVELHGSGTQSGDAWSPSPWSECSPHLPRAVDRTLVSTSAP
ncbi:Non-reducing polyketide synthase nscA [Colletotrichum spinosum]|uniref:Non-reducing polyketide synthase nscA n=1 Tax=Colletotrichum spinosum TaxID=1347390 RepID=A0A4R8QU93_9PEZI|nr:Non-reducing polyketide synthase nscA [Colletotrichum spinosum]